MRMVLVFAGDVALISAAILLFWQGWQAVLPGRANSVDVGGIVVGSSASLLPTLATVNGVPCSLNTA